MAERRSVPLMRSGAWAPRKAIGANVDASLLTLRSSLLHTLSKLAPIYFLSAWCLFHMILLPVRMLS